MTRAGARVLPTENENGVVDDAAFARFLAELAGDEAARSRQEEAWLRRQAEEEARFTGAALDLAEQGATVTARTVTGRQHHGVVAAVAEDFLVLRHAGSPPVLLPYAAIAALRPAPGNATTEAGSPRRPLLGTRFAQALAGVAADRPRVGLVLHGGEAMGGELRSVGVDLLTLRLEGSSTVYVRVDAVAELTLFG
jgi:hypothetical protein